MTELEKAYIAGFFDGEGCISITAGMDKKKGKTPNYQVVVVMAQKQVNCLLDLQKIIGVGKVYDGSQAASRASVWRVTHVQAREFLIEILPYLKNKRGEAELAIEFIDKFNRSTHTGSYGATTQSIIDEKEEYRVALQKMKGTSSQNRGRPKKQLSVLSPR